MKMDDERREERREKEEKVWREGKAWLDKGKQDPGRTLGRT
jgi:hypothetical protein